MPVDRSQSLTVPTESTVTAKSSPARNVIPLTQTGTADIPCRVFVVAESGGASLICQNLILSSACIDIREEEYKREEMGFWWGMKAPIKRGVEWPLATFQT